MNYKSPKNKTEYWNVIDTYWFEIRPILKTFLPLFSKSWIDETPLEHKNLGEYIDFLKETKNPRLVRALNAALWNIPDDLPTNEIDGYAKFYDLCVLEKVLANV